MTTGSSSAPGEVYLGTSLPPLPVGGVYHLLAVGGVQQHLPYLSGYEAQLYLQARQSIAPRSTALGPVITIHVNMHYAAGWHTGTVWNTSGYQVASTTSTYPEQKIVNLGCVPPRLVLAADELTDDELMNELPVAARPFVWLAVWEQAGVQLLIPSFELLRSLYYYSGPWLTTLFFARIPHEQLGRLIAGPTTSNGFGVHMCVTAKALSTSEAQIIAALLSDPAYAAVIRHTHLNLVMQWLQGKATALFCTNLVLERDAYLHAQGKSFTRAKHPAFWVATVQPKERCFQFHHVLFHPLRIASLWARDASHTIEPLTDVLQELEIPKRYSNTNHQNVHTPVEGYSVVHVKCGFPWALAKDGRSAPHYLGDQITLPWEQGSPVAVRCHRPVTVRFKRLEEQFVIHGWQVRRLLLNNPNGRYGKGWSVCCYNGFLPLLGDTYSQFVLRFAISEIRSDRCCSYLVYSDQQHICVLLHHPTLQVLQDEQLQLLLNTLAGETRQIIDRHTRYPASWQQQLKPIYIEQLRLSIHASKNYAVCERILNSAQS